jgi:hypothetical protein
MVNGQQFVADLDLLRIDCGDWNSSCKKAKIQCSCLAMPKRWRFLCLTSLTRAPNTGMRNVNMLKFDEEELIVIVIRIADSNIAFPSDCIEVIRSRPFAFSARRCNKFSVDRVLLAGDAAHVFPPCKVALNDCDFLSF